MNRTLRLYDPTLFWLALTATVLGMLFVFDAGYPRSIAAGRGAIPKEFLMQALFKKYVKPKYPEADLNEPFDIPYGIWELKLQPGQATIVY